MDLFYHMHTDMETMLKMIVYSNMASTSTETDASTAALQSTNSYATSSASASTSPEPMAGSSTGNSGTSNKARLEDLVDATTEGNSSTHGDVGSSTSTSNADSTATAGDAANSGGGGSSNSDSTYECTICLETAKDAVVSLCGHLFCWPCLHQWLETRPQRQMCPVCKAAISKDKVIPLYGRDNKNQQDPRTKAPPRPTAQRTEPESSNFHGFGFPDGGGFHMSFGIGAFPFGFITSSFNFGSEARPAHASEEEQFLSKLFLWVGILFLAWLILA